jgi:hypothetical protein
MSSLTFTEKRRLEQFLGMSSGYVLNYTNREFAELVLDSTGCDIFHERYNRNSGSKANRLRAFWDKENDALVGKLLTAILDSSEATGAQAEICKLTVARLLGATSPQKAAQTFPSASPSVDPTHHARLSEALTNVMRLAPQPRGFAFERFLDDAFASFNLAPRKSFRLVGEQIDGSFHLAHETYLVEAKWQDPQIGNRELQSFAGVVRGKSTWSRGLYVSYSGFSADGLEAFGRGDATRIICINGLELWQIFTHTLDFAEVLSLKTRRAAETGRAHFSVGELFQL